MAARGVVESWTLAGLADEQRPAAFQAVVDETHLPWHVQAAAESVPSIGRVLRARAEADLVATWYRGEALTVTREATELARTEGAWYGVNCVLAGTQTISQNGQRHEVHSGGMLLWSSGAPARIEVSAPGVRYLTMLVPAATLDAIAPHAERVLGRPLTLEGAGRLLQQHMISVVRYATELEPAAVAAAISAGVELLGAAVNADADRLATGDAKPTIERLLGYIDRQLWDPALNAESIAAAHGISLRTLYRIFDEAGSGSVAEAVRERRLTRCYDELAQGDAESVGAVAARWGFLDPAHFSRAFKRRFGVSPVAVLRGTAEAAG